MFQSDGARDHKVESCAPVLASAANICEMSAPVQPVLPPLEVR
jgi:hypothetical protein